MSLQDVREVSCSSYAQQPRRADPLALRCRASTGLYGTFAHRLLSCPQIACSGWRRDAALLYAQPARTHSGGGRDKPRMKYYRPLHRGVEATDGHTTHRAHNGPGYTMDHVEETALAGPCETSKQAAVCCACADPCRILT